MSRWYNREGLLLVDMRGHNFDDEYLGKMQLIEGLLGDPAYSRVAETTLPDGKWVSTVWLGLDHSFDERSAPLIFETMVFGSKERMDGLDQERYSTEAEALAGHRIMVEKWSKVAAHRDN